MPPLRIAVAQLPISPDVATNLDAVRRVLRAAADRRARLVLFAEGMLSGYAVEQHASWAGFDWDGLREAVGSVAELAGELGLWVVIGSAHRLTPPHLPHNSLYVISDEGRVVERYDKRLCSHTETQRFYTPGREATVFEVDGYTFGCAVCVEGRFPELFAAYERLGVDCVLFPAYPVDETLELQARAHAGTNCYWVAMSGPSQTVDLLRSRIVGPDGRPVAEVAPGEELVVAALDRADPAYDVALSKARPWRAAVRDGYHDHALVEDPRSSDRTVL